MSPVLVTGASGFLGLPTLSALVDRGDEVHALCTRASPPELAGVRWHRADLGDQVATERLLDRLGVEQLVHLAWYVEHGRFWDSPENVVWGERSLRLLRSFVRCGGRRAVLVGTCAEYDWSQAGQPLREQDSPIAPATLYGVAKDALRRLACAYAEVEELELAWGRMFFLYGPREAPGRLVSSVIRSLLAGEPVPTTRGTQRRDFMHAADAAGALAALLHSTVTGPVNVATGQATPVAEVLELIAAAVGRPELVRRGELPERTGDPPLLVADTRRLRELVGFTPRIALGEGIAESVEWWRTHPAASSPAEATRSG